MRPVQIDGFQVEIFLHGRFQARPITDGIRGVQLVGLEFGVIHVEAPISLFERQLALDPKARHAFQRDPIAVARNLREHDDAAQATHVEDRLIVAERAVEAGDSIPIKKKDLPPALEGAEGDAAVTVWMDVSATGRRRPAARRLTELHALMAERGYELLMMMPMNENNDTAGFWVTYRPAD